MPPLVAIFDRPETADQQWLRTWMYWGAGIAVALVVTLCVVLAR
jgi:hypothetical protein